MRQTGRGKRKTGRKKYTYEKPHTAAEYRRRRRQQQVRIQRMLLLLGIVLVVICIRWEITPLDKGKTFGSSRCAGSHYQSGRKSAGL